MAEFTDRTGATLHRVDFTGADFERINLTDATLRSVDMTGTQIRGVLLDHVVMNGAEIVDLHIDGEIGTLTVNGIDVAGYVNAELDRRHPERPKMRPTDPDGYREAWAILEQLWAGTVARARALDPELLHESVNGEWSFIETLRHLVFATNSWIRRAILGDPTPWHPLDLPWDEAYDRPGIPKPDRTARPTLDEILDVRAGRMATMRDLLANLTSEQLASHTTPVQPAGWPESRAYPVSQCLLCILNEEWEHRRFAERDLAILETRQA